MSANSRLQMNGYETILSNCKKGKEGLLLAIKEGTFTSAEKVSESNERNILSTKIEYPECTIRLIVAHGPQEGEDPGVKNEFYESLMVEIERGKASE